MDVLYLLDTDIASYAIRGSHPEVDRRIDGLAPTGYCISVVTYAELMYGTQRFPPRHPWHANAAAFVERTAVVDLGREAADTYARLRHQLSVQGMPLADMDLLIAAHAISLGAVLVTNNTRHFGRLAPLLTIENWVDET